MPFDRIKRNLIQRAWLVLLKIIMATVQLSSLCNGKSQTKNGIKHWADKNLAGGPFWLVAAASRHIAHSPLCQKAVRSGKWSFQNGRQLEHRAKVTEAVGGAQGGMGAGVGSGHQISSCNFEPLFLHFVTIFCSNNHREDSGWCCADSKSNSDFDIHQITFMH